MLMDEYSFCGRVTNRCADEYNYTRTYIIHIIYYIIIIVYYYRHAPRALPNPHCSRGIYTTPIRPRTPVVVCAYVCVCFLVCMSVCTCVSVRARFVQGRSFGLQALREIKGVRRRLVSGAHTHTHTHTSPEYILYYMCVCVRSQVNPDRERFLISSLSLSNSYISVYMSLGPNILYYYTIYRYALRRRVMLRI